MFLTRRSLAASPRLAPSEHNAAPPSLKLLSFSCVAANRKESFCVGWLCYYWTCDYLYMVLLFLIDWPVTPMRIGGE